MSDSHQDGAQRAEAAVQDAGPDGENGQCVIHVGSGTVDAYIMNVISELARCGSVTLRSKGRSIPTAVAIANVITYEMLREKYKVGKILLDTDEEPGIGQMTSTAEILIARL